MFCKSCNAMAEMGETPSPECDDCSYPPQVKREAKNGDDETALRQMQAGGED